MQKVTIVWWTAGFGKWLAEYIWDNFSKQVEITITGRNQERWEKVCKEIWCFYNPDNIDSVKNADIVIISVPIFITNNTIKEVAPHMKSWAVLADVTSIKKTPSEYMKKYAPDNVLVIPVHPMFWPYIKKISWQVFVLTAEEKTKKDPRYIFLKRFLLERNANVEETSAIEHDKMMAVVQWLTHFVLFVLWDTIRKLDVDVALSQKFVSPVYKLLVSTVARYMNQNPWLYADIQMNNEEILNVHDIFMESANLFNSIVKRKDEKEFVNQINQASKHFGASAEEWQKYTDKIVYLIWKQINYIKDNIWKQMLIENIYTKDILHIVIKDFDGKYIILENGDKKDINERVAVIE